MKDEYVRKPEKRGSLGREIRLYANHYSLAIKNPFKIFQYDVELTKNTTYNNKNNKTRNKPISKNVMKYFPLTNSKLFKH